MARTSIARKIKFAHVAKDGKTPVFNVQTQKWSYIEAPSITELTSSAERFNAVDSTATMAKTKADNAHTLAETKVTADEAVTAARNGMFTITTIGNTALPFQSIEFLETTPGYFEVIIHKGIVTGSPDSGNTGSLAYASLDYVDDIYDSLLALEKRVANIEKLLGKT